MRTGHLARKFLCSALPGLLLAVQLVPPAQAAQVAIATAPLYITTVGSLVKPNVLFIMDDSSSMDYNYLPDEVPWDLVSLGNPNPQTDSHAVALTSSQCNGVAYNPTIIYTPPIKHDGTSYPNASPTGAWVNGFNTSAGSPQILTSHFYYTYTGTQTALSYTYSNGVVDTGTTFYQECNSTTTNAAPKFEKKLVSDLSAPPTTGLGSRVNYANWYSYYRTRLLMMKTLTGHVFQPLTPSHRIGFSTLHDTGVDESATFLPISDFTEGVGSQKEMLLTKLYAISVSATTEPLRYTPTRGALSKAGRYFAGKFFKGDGTPADSLRDPMQHSCQQNFTLLASDGYWNSTDDVGATPNAATNFGPYALDNMTMVGNMDGLGTKSPMFEGNYPNGATVSNSLADVAMYYYETDLRRPGPKGDPNNTCTSGSTGNELCPEDSFGQYEPNVPTTATDNNPKPHMTTFTVGLAINGLLGYSPTYATDNAGDFNAIKKGQANWPDPRTTATVFPFADTKKQVIERVDDLWHTAVNGRGTYFNAKTPPELAAALQGALSGVSRRLGFGSAGATSSLAPTTGNNSLYVASYTTKDWTGNLIRERIDPDTGEVIPLDSSGWCVEDVASCEGEMANQVGKTSDSRTIYFNKALTLTDFTYANLPTSPDLQAHFISKVNNLSQFGFCGPAPLAPCTWPGTDAERATWLVQYLRGQSRYEYPVSPDLLFRQRNATLGDIVDTQPVFLGKPFYLYSDPGYSAWKASVATARDAAKTVFVSGNDGMLHAFDAETGVERWAFVPTAVMPNMYLLADNAYANNHHNYVNGRLVWSDVCFGTAAQCADSATADWHTILMGALNGGGRGYYALDVTDPTSPKMLWEFTASATNPDLGYSFGNPLAVKRNGKWVVLVASGYDNGAKDSNGSNYAVAGSGRGLLYVLNPKTGAVEDTYDTGVGTATTPSGLARIGYWADSPETNATALYAYGGDLAGNLWRFDMNKASGDTGAVIKLATFTDGTTPQPITTRPEMTMVGLNRMIFTATGKYLEVSDLQDRQTQSLYAIVDNGTEVADPRALAKRKFEDDDANLKRTVAPEGTLDPALGWFVDFPDAAVDVGGSERSNVDMILAVGTLIVPTNVPMQDICNAGGKSWINFLNYKTGLSAGGPATDTAGILFNADLTTGINAVWIGKNPSIIRTGTASKPAKVDGMPLFAGVKPGVKGHRVGWREIFTK